MVVGLTETVAEPAESAGHNRGDAEAREDGCRPLAVLTAQKS